MNSWFVLSFKNRVNVPIASWNRFASTCEYPMLKSAFERKAGDNPSMGTSRKAPAASSYAPVLKKWSALINAAFATNS